MRLHLTLFSLVVALLMIFAPTAQSATDRVSEAGEKLRIRPNIRYTVDAVKAVGLDADLKSGRELYERAIQSDSTYAPARYALAQLLLYDRPDSAMLHARKAYQSDTTNRWYLSTYAQSLLGVEGYAEAIQLYQKLITIDPRDINAYRILAILLNRNKQPHEAIALLDSAEVKAGPNSYLIALKRDLLLSTNQVERAMAETQALVKESPYSAEYRIALADLYAAIESDSLAAVEYNDALRIDSMRVESLIPYAAFLEKRGREAEYLDIMRLLMQSPNLNMEDKIALVKELTNDNEKYRRNYIRIGDLIRTLLLQSPQEQSLVELQTRHLISMGMVEEALKFMKLHIEDEPPQIDYYRTVVNIERHLNRPDSADRYLMRASELFPEESSLRYERAYILSQQQRYDEAIGCYVEELGRSTTDSLRSSVLGIIGDLYHRMAEESRESGDIKEAAKRVKRSYKFYDDALKLDPNNSLVLNNYAYFLSENDGDLAHAYKMSKRSTELDQGNPTYLDTYAWILYRMRRFARAKVVMRQAISFDRSENGEIALHYGEILAVLGEQTMANFYWEKAISWGMTKEQVAESRARAAEMAKMGEVAEEKEEEKEEKGKNQRDSDQKRRGRSK